MQRARPSTIKLQYYKVFSSNKREVGKIIESIHQSKVILQFQEISWKRLLNNWIQTCHTRDSFIISSNHFELRVYNIPISPVSNGALIHVGEDQTFIDHPYERSREKRKPLWGLLSRDHGFKDGLPIKCTEDVMHLLVCWWRAIAQHKRVSVRWWLQGFLKNIWNESRFNQLVLHYISECMFIRYQLLDPYLNTIDCHYQ